MSLPSSVASLNVFWLWPRSTAIDPNETSPAASHARQTYFALQQWQRTHTLQLAGAGRGATAAIEALGGTAVDAEAWAPIWGLPLRLSVSGPAVAFAQSADAPKPAWPALLRPLQIVDRSALPLMLLTGEMLRLQPAYSGGRSWRQILPRLQENLR